MEKIFVTDMELKQKLTSFFMVKAANVRPTKNSRYYLDILLGDKTGEIPGKRWDVVSEEIPMYESYQVGDIVKVMGTVTEFGGKYQFTISRIRHALPDDNVEIWDYVKAAPEEGPDMYAYIYGTAEKFSDEDLKTLCLSQLADKKEKLLYYPAASKNHHAEMCGLLWHMKRMLMSGIALCDVYMNLDKDLVAAGVILHDLQKVNEIRSNEYGVSDGYTFEGNMLGHLVMGVRELDKVMDAQGMPHEKKILIEHMVLSHHYEPEFGSPVRPLFPEAEMLHYLDVLDAKMFDMEDILANVKPGEFTEKVRTLNNRRLYKRMEGSAGMKDTCPCESENSAAGSGEGSEPDEKAGTEDGKR